MNDLSSSELIQLARQIRDRGTLGSGREIRKPPRLFIGGADLPLDPPADWQPTALLGKIEAGVDFVQTQYCFDVGRARRYLARISDFGIPARIHVLIGIGPLRSARQARWMRENLYGVEIGDDIVERLERARDGATEGRRICLDLIAQFREIPGIAGVHLMAPNQEAEIARTIEESGLLSLRENTEGGE